MNELQIFNNSEFGEIRTVTIDNEIWFVGRDVANALGYAKPQNAIRDNVEEGDALTKGILDSNNHLQQMLIINESGMYDLVMGSKLPSAKKFKRWITHDVIPSIRKTGSYHIPQTPDEKIQLIAQGYVEIKKDIKDVKDEVQQLKDELPLFPIEAQLLTDAVKKKGVEVLGGKESVVYNDRGIRQCVYLDIYGELHRNFAINSYRALRRNQLDKALEVIGNYKLPVIIQDKITSFEMEVVDEDNIS